MRQSLYLLISIVIIIAIGAGCSSQNTGVSMAGADGVNAGAVSAARVSSSEGAVSGAGIAGSAAKTNKIMPDGNIAGNGTTGNTAVPDATASDTTTGDTAAGLKPSPYTAVNDFKGVSMIVKDGTTASTGLTLVFENKSDSRCIYGSDFALEKKINGSWYMVPVVIEGGYGFNSIGFDLEPDEESEWSSDWEWLYGSLETGEYRIVKDILDFRYTGDYDTYYLAAEFIVTH